MLHELLEKLAAEVEPNDLVGAEGILIGADREREFSLDEARNESDASFNEQIKTQEIGEPVFIR